MSSAVPQLRELSASITRRSFDALVEHLLPHMIALRRLVVHIFDDRHSSHDALDHLIALNTETLEHLATHHMVPSLPLPRLCTLSLSSGQGTDVFLIYVRDILTFIRSITTSMLEELVLRSSAAHLLSHLHSHSAQWDGLQDLILSVAWQCCLVVCTLENVSDELSDLQMHPSFERLRAAGRITFVGKSIRDFQRMEE
ncbi:hypothetical protein CPB85DRAFT_1015895 [Mucidula mucida]|nr:hypothetical protein CPB85DRAFT_1015895 [Mucidula mucida]